MSASLILREANPVPTKKKRRFVRKKSLVENRLNACTRNTTLCCYLWYNYHVLILDIDECSTENHRCHGQAYCTDTIGSFICTCNEGFTGNGEECAGMRIII